jgi:hypothetical protein
LSCIHVKSEFIAKLKADLWLCEEQIVRRVFGWVQQCWDKKRREKINGWTRDGEPPTSSFHDQLTII